MPTFIYIDYGPSPYIARELRYSLSTLLAEATDRLIARQTALIGESRRFDGLTLPPDAARKLLLLKLSIGLPAPADPALREYNAYLAELAKQDAEKENRTTA